MDRLAQQAGDDAAFAVAELGLAVALEDLLDRAAGRRLDLRVGIDELKAKLGGQPAPNARLARAHQTDEHNRLGDIVACRITHDRHRDVRNLGPMQRCNDSGAYLDCRKFATLEI